MAHHTGRDPRRPLPPPQPTKPVKAYKEPRPRCGDCGALVCRYGTEYVCPNCTTFQPRGV